MKIVSSEKVNVLNPIAPCSAANKLELGAKSVSLACSATSSLDMENGQCNSCSGYPSIDPPQMFCRNIEFILIVIILK